MSWRDDLRRVSYGGRQLIGASFRGVPFLVASSEMAGGRRAIVNQFPDRDDPFVEDLGRSARSFRVEAYVLGNAYVAERNAVLDALEAAGPGELVHPYHGVRRAQCMTYSVREASAEGGFASFAIEFAEAPLQAVAPTIDDDPVTQVGAAADRAVAASRAELVASYDVAGLPAFALSTVESAIAAAATELEAQLLPIVTTTQEAAELAGRVRLIVAQSAALARAPGDAIDALRGAIVGLVDVTLGAPAAVLTALLDAYEVTLGALAPETTATRRRERAAQAAMHGAIRRMIAIEAARLVPRAAYESIEAATIIRDRAAAQLDEQAAGAGDVAYPELVALRAQVLRAVPGAAMLSRLITVERRTAVPSLLLAYQLYGEVSREAELVARNRIQHPGVIAGQIQVISNAE